MKSKKILTLLMAVTISVLGVFLSNDVVFSESLTSTESNVEFEIEDSIDLEALEKELALFIKSNPDSNEEEQDGHLTKFIQNGGLSRDSFINNEKHVSTYGVGDYLPGYKSLNSAEKKLAKAHPAEAVKVYSAAKKAESNTVKVYGGNNWGDNSDAFRHCLWNALMKKSIGSSSASKWATAHEYGSSGIDKTMDLHNNSIGRSINVDYLTETNIITHVKSKVRNGYCKRIINNKLVKTNGSGMK